MREEDASLFRHVGAERGAFYRKILDVFASARRQFRLQLRPDDILAEGLWNEEPPQLDDLNLALGQLTTWGNLETQADLARVASVSMFYRARYLYRLTKGGESVEASLQVFHQSMQRKAELLRARARAAIPQLLGAINALNERRSGRSDRSAEFRMLAHWFAACEDDDQAHRMARAAFALNPARHFSLNPKAASDVPATTPWADAPPLTIHPRIREYGEAAPRGPHARVRDRSADRAQLGAFFAEEAQQVEAARSRIATGLPFKLSDIGEWDNHEFGLFLTLLGDALTQQASTDAIVERQTGDGLLRIRLEPLDASTRAVIQTPAGSFSGRDHVLTIFSTTNEA